MKYFSFLLLAKIESKCAAEDVLKECLSSRQASVKSCFGDSACLCAAHTALETCYANCPDDAQEMGDRKNEQSQVTIYCNNASISASQAMATIAPQTARASTISRSAQRAMPNSSGSTCIGVLSLFGLFF